MRQILFAFFLILSFSQVRAGGIEFFHGTWEEALEMAQVQDKLIFVDAYTTWCGPCKRMSKNVFTESSVGDFYNKNFISMKIDMEKKAGRKFQRKYPVSAYPTLYYIDGGGKAVHMTKGGRNPQEFIALGKEAMKKNDKSGDFAKDYEAGKRDPELIYNYVKALNKAGKPSLKISNEYIKSQKDLTTEHNLRFILEATTEADSRIFGLLIKNRAKIEALTSKEMVHNKIEAAAQRTVDKAIEFESMDLLKEAKDKMKSNYSAKAAEFATLADMRFYQANSDVKNYLKATNTYAKKVIKNDPEQLNALILRMLGNYPTDKKVLAQAEKMAQKASKKGGESKYYFTYASILLKNGKKKEALASAKKSLKLSKGDKKEEMLLKQMIQKIEGQS